MKKKIFFGVLKLRRNDFGVVNIITVTVMVAHAQAAYQQRRLSSVLQSIGFYGCRRVSLIIKYSIEINGTDDLSKTNAQPFTICSSAKPSVPLT